MIIVKIKLHTYGALLVFELISLLKTQCYTLLSYMLFPIPLAINNFYFIDMPFCSLSLSRSSWHASFKTSIAVFALQAETIGLAIWTNSSQIQPKIWWFCNRNES